MNDKRGLSPINPDKEDIKNGSPYSSNYYMPWASQRNKFAQRISTKRTVIAAWTISVLLFYLFGLDGPFGRFTFVFQVGVPAYLTFVFLTNTHRK